MKKVLVILGPTATGKTDLALSLAKKFNGELVSCDSRQVYIGLDIGTGKMSGQDLGFKKFDLRWEIDGIKVWMYDVVNPQTRYTVSDYVKQANKVIEDILKRDKLPIIVGGTGLYLKALLEGLSNLEIPVDEKLRGELEELSLEQLQEKLKLLSPAKFESLNNSEKNNKRRLLRSIELIHMNPRLPRPTAQDAVVVGGPSPDGEANGGQAYMTTSDKQQSISDKYNVLKIGLTAPREVLNKRIDLRLISRIDQGLIEEGERLLKEGITLERMRELGLEYGVLAQLLTGDINREQFIETLKIKIHQYAKRQMTWFKNPSASSGCTNWFDITDKRVSDEVEKLVLSWYDKHND